MMWPRVCEILLALWLAASPMIFGHQSDPLPRVVDWAAAVLIAALAAMSFVPRLHRAHLGEIAVALALMGYGYFAGAEPPSPAMQNDLLVGLLLAMFAIIPSRASDPPRAWQAFHEQQK